VSASIVAVSMGDPAGIGPEVTLRAIASPSLRRRIAPILVGDLGVLRETADRLRLRLDFHLREEHPVGARHPRGSLPVEVVSALPPRARRPGRPVPEGGDAAFRAVLAAVALVRAGVAGALTTAPISKANLHAAGHRVPGHTELLAQLSRARTVRMMMAARDLRVVLATTHVALGDVPRLLTRRVVLDTIDLTHAELRARFGLTRPRIAVCGLNPHAGEGGLFGKEDERSVRPAVESARRRRIDARGPLPADTVFAHAVGGAYDAVVCMYHDQGLAPFKLIHFTDGVNVTLGLPFVRTSPDHGTAFDIAGRGVADPRSMIAALELAARLGRAG